MSHVAWVHAVPSRYPHLILLLLRLRRELARGRSELTAMWLAKVIIALHALQGLLSVNVTVESSKQACGDQAGAPTSTPVVVWDTRALKMEVGKR